MRTLTRYFWRVYYVFRPVKGGLLSDLLRSTARKQGVRIVEHRLVRRTTSYSGLGWVAGNEEKDLVRRTTRTSRRAAEEWDKYFQKEEAKEAVLRRAEALLRGEKGGVK